MSSPLKAAALELGLPVTDQVNDVLGAVTGGAELGVVVAFGQLIKTNLLDALPFVNLHFSLLPRWRGAAPVERAFLEGDTETGVCLMELEKGLDTGGVYRRVSTPIAPEDTGVSLLTRLSAIGSTMLVDALAPGTVAALGIAEPQVGDITWAQKLDASDHLIDWRDSTERIDRVIRLGGAWTIFRGKRIKIIGAVVSSGTEGAPGTLAELDVRCGDVGSMRLVAVQPEGKPPMDAVAWRNGVRPITGERFEGGLQPVATRT